MSQISSIDDVLVNAATNTQPPVEIDAEDELDDVSRETDELEISDSPDEYKLSEESPAEEVAEASEKELDDYGNEQPAAKTYTEDEVNDRINSAVRERLARLERNNVQVPNQQQAHPQPSGFEYNAESNEPWQQQLESFVEQTVSKMSQKQNQQAYQAREHQIQAEFEQKFTQGMSKFRDYQDVVGAQPISDAMVLASRSIKDPASFFYAAAKRAPQELQRISQIQDHYAQIAEIGKLEERMKQTKSPTKAPKPISRTVGDTAIPNTEKKELSIEQMIQNDAARRLAFQKKRRG